MATKSNQQLTFLGILSIILFLSTACQPIDHDKGFHKEVSLKYPNGKPKILIYTFMEDSAVHTHYTSFYANGKVRETYHLKNGLKQHEYMAFHYDGQTKEYGIYENGLENGEYISYYPNRRYLSRINWKEGVFHGKSTYFYPNGKPIQTGQFVDGLKDGEWIDYDMEGIVSSRQIYKMGKLID